MLVPVRGLPSAVMTIVLGLAALLTLTPDIIYPSEIDFMKGSHLMDTHDDYDQSNWVVLRDLQLPSSFKGYVINGGTLKGKLLNKKNPEILVTSTPQRGVAV